MAVIGHRRQLWRTKGPRVAFLLSVTSTSRFRTSTRPCSRRARAQKRQPLRLPHHTTTSDDANHSCVSTAPESFNTRGMRGAEAQLYTRAASAVVVTKRVGGPVPPVLIASATSVSPNGPADVSRETSASLHGNIGAPCGLLARTACADYLRGLLARITCAGLLCGFLVRLHREGERGPTDGPLLVLGHEAMRAVDPLPGNKWCWFCGAR
jgi:hypothetical protein